MFTIQQGIPCFTLTLCASRRSFGPRTGHWHVYAPRRVCGGRHTKGDHPHVVRLPSRRSRWRRRHDRSRRGGRILAAKRREQTVHRTAWAVRLARKHADRESHERGIKCVQPPLLLHVPTVRLTGFLFCSPPSHRLQDDPIYGSPRAEKRPQLQSGGTSHPRHRARLEHPRQPRTHGRNHVRGVSGACILHREHRRIKRVRLKPLFVRFGAVCDDLGKPPSPLGLPQGKVPRWSLT